MVIAVGRVIPVLAAALLAACGGSSSAPHDPPRGCAAAAGCAPGLACNLRNGLCEAVCDADHDCNGCCQGTSCVPGTSAPACGAAGASCQICGVGASACIEIAGGGRCGCNASTDCGAAMACNTRTHTCGAACGAVGIGDCNEGCCTNGVCVDGTSDGACGWGPVCAVCSYPLHCNDWVCN